MGGSQSQSTSAPLVSASVTTTGKPKGDIVIIPVDASKHAEAAFLWYLKHVHRPENVVQILHCQEPHSTSPVLAEHAFRSESWADTVAAAHAAGAKLVKEYEQKLVDHNVTGQVQFEVGRPGEVVVSAAAKLNADMVIMGTRGFGLIRRTVLGSVSEYVIHHSAIPVTVVPKDIQHRFF